MPSFRVFGIKVDKTQTAPRDVDSSSLNEEVSSLISDKVIHKVVVEKNWV